MHQIFTDVRAFEVSGNQSGFGKDNDGWAILGPILAWSGITKIYPSASTPALNEKMLRPPEKMVQQPEGVAEVDAYLHLLRDAGLGDVVSFHHGDQREHRVRSTGEKGERFSATTGAIA
jgi:hypothetical protein